LQLGPHPDSYNKDSATGLEQSMPRDSFNREIDYLRISVIDNCNLRCVYCMPLDGLRFLPRDELLTSAEIELWSVPPSVSLSQVSIDGGEPTLRADLLEIVERLAAIPELGDLALTTNALLLPKLAAPLKAAGPQPNQRPSRQSQPAYRRAADAMGSFARVWEGIMAAEAAGLVPIKLNAVVARRLQRRRRRRPCRADDRAGTGTCGLSS